MFTAKTIVILVSKKLFPPEDGQADLIRKLVDFLLADEKFIVYLISFTKQQCKDSGRLSYFHIEPGLNLYYSALSFIKGDPLQVALYANPKIKIAIKSVLQNKQIDAVIADLARLADIALYIKANKHILNMTDRLSKRYSRQAANDLGIVSLGKRPEFLPKPYYRFLHYFERFILNYEALRMKKYEENIVRRFDWTVLISVEEAEELRNVSNIESVISIPTFVEEQKNGSPGIRQKAMVFLGNISVAHNRDAACYIAEEIFPAVKKEIPDAEYWIVGRAVGNALDSIRYRDGIKVFENVPSVSAYLWNASVAICTLRYGSGIKTKILEAFAHGIPVVTNWVGAEGVPRAEDSMYIRNTPAEIANQVVSIIQNEDLSLEKIKNGYCVLQESYSKEIVKTKWMNIL